MERALQLPLIQNEITRKDQLWLPAWILANGIMSLRDVQTISHYSLPAFSTSRDCLIEKKNSPFNKWTFVLTRRQSWLCRKSEVDIKKSRVGMGNFRIPSGGGMMWGSGKWPHRFKTWMARACSLRYKMMGFQISCTAWWLCGVS